MILRILPHVTLCEAAGQFILLDIRQDRYLAVPPLLDGAFRQWLVATEMPLPEPIGRLLARSRIWATGDPGPRVSTEHIPLLKLLEMRRATPEPNPDFGFRRVLMAVATTSLRLRYQRLQSVLDRHVARRVYRSSRTSFDFGTRIAAFERARAFVPVARNCLLDTLALDTWLRHGDHECRVIFGVTAKPFAAHCWLQRGGTVLNDSPDRISRFTPILSV